MKTNEITELMSDSELLNRLYLFSYRRVNNTYEAEELCSDIIFSILSAAQKQQRIDSFYPFVWTVARRVYADYCEKRNQMRQNLSIDNLSYPLVSEENEIDSFVEEDCLRQQINKLLAEISFLSKAYREVMVMYYLDEMKVKDIASRLGIGEGTVKQRLFYGRNTLRKEVKTMNERKLSLKPIAMDFAGSGGVVGNDPFSKAERTFSKNLIYACKNTAKTAKELSDELCVPGLYVEEELEIQLRGENGTYGTLRKQGDKYIANLIIIDEKIRIEGAAIYEKYAEEFCSAFKEYTEKNSQKFLKYPYVNPPRELSGVLWVIINDAVWGFIEETEKIMEEKYFAHIPEAIKAAGRKYTFGIVARKENEPRISYGYGCDTVQANEFCGYSSVKFRNIYGKKIVPHFRCGYNITHDDVIALLLKSVGGISVELLSDRQKEAAAEGIKMGLLRKNGSLLEPAVLIIEEDKYSGLVGLLDGFYLTLAPLCEKMASEVSEHIQKHIQKHLTDEYKTYNMLICSAFLDKIIDRCIETGLLNEPKNQKGSEGVLVLVKK